MSHRREAGTAARHRHHDSGQTDGNAEHRPNAELQAELEANLEQEGIELEDAITGFSGYPVIALGASCKL